MDTGNWKISEEEMRQHNSQHSCWVCINGIVYDVTKWLKKHPDGADAILQHAGNKATEAEIGIAEQELEEFKVGHLIDPEAVAKAELLSIHPSIRMEIVSSLNSDEWMAMSYVERLAVCKARLPNVTTAVSDFEKDIAWKVAHGQKSIFEGDAPEQEESEDEEEEEGGPKYWRPEGRCPYGMDTGNWKISEEEMRQHNSQHSCWVCINGIVYDVTKWLKKHPDGADAILQHAGNKATEAEIGIAEQELEEFKVGHLIDPEAVAKAELLSIHPSIRMEIVSSLNSDEWMAMSYVERLAVCKARLPNVTTAVSDFEKDIAWKVAHGEKSIFEGDAPEQEESEDEEEDEEVMVVRKYWRPEGRCPYGMDTGVWKITEEEMRQHDSKHSCWVSIDGVVYDVTKWLKKHPGGVDAILKHAGKNATKAFRAIGSHTTAAAEKSLEKFKVGHIVEPGAAPAVCPVSGKAGVCPVKGMQGQKEEPSPDAKAAPLAPPAILASKPSAPVCEEEDEEVMVVPKGKSPGAIPGACPVSGKTGGECPRQAMQNQISAAVGTKQQQLGKGGGKGKGGTAECPIS